jgi:F0F1-type ATP synthase assembly protein I
MTLSSESPEPDGRKQPGRREEPNPWRMFGLGVEFADVVAILALGGWWLDGKFGTEPWLLLVGLFVATVGGLYNLWKIGKQYF